MRGIASPERETRAPTTTIGNFESVISGDIALLSSSVKVNGRSLTRFLRMARGMRGPWAARANTNSVSPGAALAASGPASWTIPLTLPEPVAALAWSGAAWGTTGLGPA